jgi:predicted nucleotidyltransferase
VLGVVIDDVMLGRAQQTTWRTDVGDLDVLTQVAHREGGQSYDDLIDRAVSLRLDDYELRLINLDDLIASKEAADRDKDHEALPELRRLRDER